MKITKQRLNQIIKEEVERGLQETKNDRKSQAITLIKRAKKIKGTGDLKGQYSAARKHRDISVDDAIKLLKGASIDTIVRIRDYGKERGIVWSIPLSWSGGAAETLYIYTGKGAMKVDK